MPRTLRNLTEALRRSLNSGQVVPPSEPSLRHEIFYHPNSICSQKVLAVLAHHEIAYTGRVVDIAAGETYLPDYVRIRIIGCADIPGPLARHHTGSTSVGSSGCDTAVVPTLVDWDRDEVVVDSRRICDRLDLLANRGASLRPVKFVAAIDEQLGIVDDFPNYQLRLGSPPGGGETPVMRKGTAGRSLGQSKVDRCRMLIRENQAEPALVEAYQAKLEKELQAMQDLLTVAAMSRVYEAVAASLRKLEHDLARSEGMWLFDDDVTMADLYWAIQLLRVENICGDVFWAGGALPGVRRYLAGLRALPFVQASVRVGPAGVA